MTQEDFRDWPDADLLRYIGEPSDSNSQRSVEMATIEIVRRSAFTGGGGGGVPSGSAGGSLSGSYPNPGLAANAVTNSKLAMAPALTMKGNANGVAAVPQDLTVLQVKTLLGIGSAVGWTSGVIAPAGGDGVVGDFYLNEVTGEVSKKTGASTWSVVLQATAFRGVAANNAALAALTTPRINQTAFVTDTVGIAGGSAGVAGFAYYTGTVWTVYSLVGGGGGSPANLAYTPATGVVTNSNGTGFTLPDATTTVPGKMTAAQATKLDGLSNYTHPNHSGDVVSVADGATTIQANVVTNTKLADMPAATLKGNNGGATADPVDLTVVQAQAMLEIDDLQTLSGVSAGVQSLGAFTGTTIADNVAIKPALQSLETAIETADGLALHKAGAETITGVKTFTAQPVGITATSIVNVAAGNIAATTTQAALNELDTEKQVNIQLKDEGVSLGTSGTVDIIDFVGAGVVTTRVGNTATVTIAGGSSAMTAATTTTAGVGGTVPAPPIDSQNKFLRGDATFGTAIPAWATGQVLEIGDVVYDPLTNKIYRVTTAHTAGALIALANFAELSTGGDTQYDAGNGAIVKASGTGVTFVRTTASVWTFTIPSGVDLSSFNIYSTIGENPGANVTVNFNYTGNTLTNQGLSTARRPNWHVAQAASGATAEVVVGGTAASAWRPAINTVGGGNISFLATSGSVMSTGETTIGGNF